MLVNKNLLYSQIMVDITRLIVGSDSPHTHIANINGTQEYVNISDAKTLNEVLDDVADGVDYDLYEYIADVCIPYVPFTGDRNFGAMTLYAIMKRLFNVYSPIAVLSNPYAGEEGNQYEYDHILTSPYARVNKAMLVEIM